MRWTRFDYFLRRVVVSSGAGVGLILGVCGFSISTAAQPELICDKPVYRFGAQVAGDEIVHDFVLCNRGSSPLIIESINNCCGMIASVKPIEIAPGSNAVCRTLFLTNNRSGIQKRQIILETNDPESPKFELHIEGSLLRPVEVKPRSLNLGDLKQDALLDSVIVVASNEDLVTLKRVDCSVNSIKPEYSELTENRWEITLSRTQPLPLGKLRTTLSLHFSDYHIVHVPLYGEVK